MAASSSHAAQNDKKSINGRHKVESVAAVTLADGVYGAERSPGSGIITQLGPAHTRLPSFRDLVDRLKAVVPRALASSAPYSNVLACMVGWEARAGEAAVRQELGEVLQTKYGYDVREISLPSTDAAAAEFQYGVYEHIRDINGRQGTNSDSLFILYYGGPSGYRKKDRKGLWMDRDEKGFAGIEWEKVMNRIRLVTCDVLLVLDCDFASQVVDRDIEWHGRCEVLSGNGRTGFTRDLTAALAKSADGSDMSAMQLAWTRPSAAGAEEVSIGHWQRLTTNGGLQAGISIRPISKQNGETRFPETTSMLSPTNTLDSLGEGSGGIALVSIQFSNAAKSPVAQEWIEWGKQPQENKKASGASILDTKLRELVKCHDLFDGTPAVGIVSMPVWLWSCLGRHPAWKLISIIPSNASLVPGHSQVHPQSGPAGPTIPLDDPPQYSEQDKSKPTPKSAAGDGRNDEKIEMIKVRTDSNLQRQFGSVLAAAQARYAESTGLDLKDFMQPPLRTVEDLLTVVNKQNERFGNFREKRKSLFEAMSMACKPLEVVGDALAGAASEVFPPSQNIFAAIVYLIGAAKDVSQVYDSIEELFEQLADFTSRLKFYISEKLSPELHDKVVEILATVFECLVLATKEVERGRLKSYFRRIFGQGSPIPDVIKRISVLTDAETRLVNAETNAVVKRSLSNQDRLLEIISRVDVNVQTIRTESREPQTKEQALSSNRSKLKTILRPSTYPEDTYLALNRTRTPGTGNWIVEDPSMKAWIAGDVRFLWICGNPGTGKSYLTSRLVSWGLRLLEEQETTHMLGYFFFKHNNPETRSVVQALHDMAFQISEQDVFYGKQVLKGVSNGGEEIKTVSSAFRHLLVEPLVPDQWRRNVYILLDGLDEADPVQLAEFLSLLDELSRQPVNGTRVQIAMVGRTSLSDTINSHLEVGLRVLHITPERSRVDITQYIKQGVNSTRVLRGTTPEFKQQVVDTMLAQVDGLFVLAKFMLAELARARHPRRVIEALQSYPKEINGMLTKTVLDFSASITQEEANDLNEILCWVSVAQMGLTLEQIESILTLKVGDSPFRLEEMLRSQFSAFFTLERPDGLTTADLADRAYTAIRQQAVAANVRSPDLPENDADREIEFSSNRRTTTVTFSHASVRDFFRDEASTSLRASKEAPAIGFRLTDARLHVLRTCMRIFTDPEFFTVSIGAINDEGLSLQRYAAWYWQEHLEDLDHDALPEDIKADIGRELVTMLTDDIVLLAWTNLFEESLDIWTDGNIACVQSWLADPQVTCQLSAEDKAWAEAASRSQVIMLEPMGTVFARAWVEEGFVTYMPTLFCFGVVQVLALMSEDPVSSLWSDSEHHWGDITFEMRVDKAAEWARAHISTKSNTGHSYRRIGSTLLNVGLHNRALQYFQTALSVDDDLGESCGRIGLCHSMSGDYARALRLHLIAEAVEVQNLSQALHIDLTDPESMTPSASFSKISSAAHSFTMTPASSFSSATTASTTSTVLATRRTRRHVESAKWRLYQSLRQIAQCYNRLGDVDKALGNARRAMSDLFRDNRPPFEPEAAYASILASHSQLDGLLTLARELDARYTTRDGGDSRFVSFLLSQVPDGVISLWLPEAAARRDDTAAMAERYVRAVAAARDAQDAWRELYLLNCLGRVYLCSPAMVNDAITLHETALFSPAFKPQRGSMGVRAEHVAAFAQLARAYFARALAADPSLTSWAAVSPWIGKLGVLMAKRNGLFRDSSDGARMRAAGLEFNEAAVYLMVLYRMQGCSKNLTEDRERWLSKMRRLAALRVMESLELLEDDEPQNDAVAVRNLQRTLLAAGDDANARALWVSSRRPTTDRKSPSVAKKAAGTLSPTLGGSKGKATPPIGPGVVIARPDAPRRDSPGGGSSRLAAGVSPHRRSSAASPHRHNSGSGSPRTSPSMSPSPRRKGRDLVLPFVFDPAWMLTDEDEDGGGGQHGGFAGSGGSYGGVAGANPVCDFCLRRLEPAEELFVCKVCLDCKFCTPCLALVKAGTKGKGSCVCSAEHAWLAVPPLERELKAGEILVGGGGGGVGDSSAPAAVMKLEEWKAGLRLKWVVARGRTSGANSRALSAASGGSDRGHIRVPSGDSQSGKEAKRTSGLGISGFGE